MKINPENERKKHEYFAYLKEARQLSDSSIDVVAKALERFEVYTGRKPFDRFHREQAIAFKSHLSERVESRAGKPLSKTTVDATLSALRAFFFWLAREPGYKGRIHYSDADYFNLSLKDRAVAKAVREPRVPTLGQIGQVLDAMPTITPIERRNRAVVAYVTLTGARVDAAASMRLKDVDLEERQVFQDARHVRTKFSKSFPTFFFPVGDEIEAVFVGWVQYLREEHGFGPEDPLFPPTRTIPGVDGEFSESGFLRQCWSTSGPIREIFKSGFAAAGLPYFNPHSLRKTLVRLAMEREIGDETMKAWSQNLGHEDVQTTYRSYGELPAHRQRDLMRAAVKPRDDESDQVLALAKELAAAARRRGG